MTDSKEYFTNKISLLKQCLEITEELISKISDWESLEDVLSRRQVVIDSLQKLEKGAKENKPLSPSEEDQVNQLLKLIIDLDKDAKKLLQEERDKTIQLLKSNVQGQKVMDYVKHDNPEYQQQGRRFDIKE